MSEINDINKSKQNNEKSDVSDLNTINEEKVTNTKITTIENITYRTNSIKLIIIDILIAIIGFAIDQFVKKNVIEPLSISGPKVLIDGILELTYVENRGAAFGILNGQKTVFLIIAVIVVVIMAYVFYKLPPEKKYLKLNICLSFVLAGALGNTYDRLALGYVRDFIYFRIINFPVFNVADIYITVCMFWLFIMVLFVYKEDDFLFLKKQK